MGFDNAYEAITEENDHQRWAFGTGFSDALVGVEMSAPTPVDGAGLSTFCLQLGDDALVMSHRLQEWCTNAPELEEEVALANIALDLLGQARLLYTRAGVVDGTGRDEDALAYWRDADEFRNVRLAELPCGDFAEEMARMLVYSTWRLALFEQLRGHDDPVVAAIAAKAVKEMTYHRDYAAGWVIRLGDGTAYSHERMEHGMAAVWPYVPALFDDLDDNARAVRAEFDSVLAQVLILARLATPESPAVTASRGEHGPEFHELLNELQGLARAHPEAVW